MAEVTTYQPVVKSGLGGVKMALMEPDQYGGWVAYSDYLALSTRVSALEAELKALGEQEPVGYEWCFESGEKWLRYHEYDHAKDALHIRPLSCRRLVYKAAALSSSGPAPQVPDGDSCTPDWCEDGDNKEERAAYEADRDVGGDEYGSFT